MGESQRLAFEDEIDRRIYEYVERNGGASRAEARDAVRVERRLASKPARTGPEVEEVPIDPAEFDERVARLEADGLLVADGNRLRVATEGEYDPETVVAGDEEVTIRPARQDDLGGIVDAIREVTAERTHIVAESVAEAVDQEGALLRRNDRVSRMFFVATDAEDAVVGWVEVHGSEMEKLRHTAELTVGVREAHREHGIGSALLSAGIEWADDAGYRKVYQSVPATNEVAVDLLEANGWTVEATRDDHYLVDGDLVDEVMLAVRLDE